jgi:tetratricopeptide (TPR) repeat protein
MARAGAKARLGARAGVAFLVAGLVLGLGLAAARADEKKPGMFDFEKWKMPVTREREAAGQIAPQGLDLTPAVPSNGEPRLIRLRVYADSDYRGVVIRWQARVRGQLARINAVTGPVFNVKFEIESLRSWDRSHVGMAFDPILKELEALDPAREVDLVLGLVTPARGVATSLHQLGEAFTPGRHIVLRGMDDEQEALAIDRDYHLMPDDERQRLYLERRGHKEVVLFLHEWGHSAGLLHEEDRSMIMNPAYDPRQTAFGPFDKQVLALVIEKRLATPGEAFPERAELLKLFEKAPPDIGSNKERSQLLAFLRSSPSGRPQSGAAPPSATGLSNAEVDAFNSAVAAAKTDHPEEAWKILAPLLQRLRGGEANADAWTRAAQLATAIGALTVAEEAIGHVPRGGADIEKVAADVEMTRQRVALPPGAKAGVTPDQEPAYVAGFWAIARLVGEEDLKTARVRLGAFAAAFPDAPAVDLLTCDLELRAKHAAAATKRCEAAVAKYRYAQRAHYLLGLLAARAGRGAVAEQQLQVAIRIDPQDAGAWRTLGQLYRSQRARGRLDELARKYQAAFAAPLPQ